VLKRNYTCHCCPIHESILVLYTAGSYSSGRVGCGCCRGAVVLLTDRTAVELDVSYEVLQIGDLVAQLNDQVVLA